MKLKLLLLLIFAATLASAQTSTVRSVSVLPATCNPGGGAGGSPADHVDLWDGSINTAYYCAAANTWVPVACQAGICKVVPNGASCTTLHGGVEYDGTGAAQTATANSNKVVGIAISNAGCSGNVTILYGGLSSGTFDGTTSNNDFFAPSPTPGQFTDIGAVRVPTVQTLGKIRSVNSGAGTLASVDYMSSDTQASGAAGGSGTVSNCGSIGPIYYSSTIGAITVCDPNATLDGNGNMVVKKVTVGSGTGVIDATTGASPGNPSAGNIRLYGDSGTGNLTCLTSAGGNCLPGSGSLAFSAITGATNTVAAMVVGTGASLATSGSGTIAATSAPFSGITGSTNTTAAMLVGSGASVVPNNNGQVSGITNWLPIAPTAIEPPAPTLSTAVGGGTLTTGTLMYVKITFAGQSVVVPSGEVNITTAGCTSNCTVTVNMPAACTSPVAPTTGCTVWDDTIGIGLEKQQTASAACVNITSATCVIGTAGVGATLTTPTTTGTNPPNLQANANTPDFIIPTIFMQKGDTNYYPIAGVDISGRNWPLLGGTFTFFDRFFVNDNPTTAPISNALVSIEHMGGNTTNTGATFDDRALTVRFDDSASASPSWHQALTQYNERIITNNNFNCNPIGGGKAVGESCASAGRFITSDVRVTPANNVSSIDALAGVTSIGHTSGGVASCDPCYIGIKGGVFESVSSVNLGGNSVAGIYGQVGGGTSNSNGTAYTFYAAAPDGVRFASQNIGYKSADFGTNAADWDFLAVGSSNGTSGQSLFQGDIWIPDLRAAASTINVTGSLGLTGAIGTAQLATPTIQSLSTFGTAGSTSDSYKVTCADVNGNETTATGTSTIATANADLTAVHGNNINMATNNNGCSSYNIYRTAATSTCNGGACTNGKLGSVAVPLMGSGRSNAVTFADTGQAGDSNTAVAQPNSTAAVKAFELQSLTNCSAVGSAANPSLVACSAASAGSFSCATNASTGTCVISTTAVTANSEILLTQRTDTTTGTRLGVTCNTGISTTFPAITAVTAQTSFTINLGTVAVNPECWSYLIVN